MWRRCWIAAARKAGSDDEAERVWATRCSTSDDSDAIVEYVRADLVTRPKRAAKKKGGE